MKLTIDFETRSKIDLKKCGMYRYAEDESTDVLCLSVKKDNACPQVYIPDKFIHLAADWFPLINRQELMALINEAEVIEAHNAGFEKAIWNNVMVRYGFPKLDVTKFSCSAAKAASFALPRALGQACEALGLASQKDQTGYKVMLKWCKPRKPTKINPSEWHENKEEFALLVKYCLQDTDAEHALSNSLYDLNDKEKAVWHCDQTINDRGVYIDVNGAKHLKQMVELREKELLNQIVVLTSGYVNSPRQIASSLNWLADQGVQMESLDKAAVLEALKTATGNAKKFLEIRQLLGKSSVAKLDAMINMACSDNRIRGSLLYHAATTGRFGGRGIQPQNLPRESFEPHQVDDIVALSKPLIEILYDDIMLSASKSIRGLIKAAPGKKLYCADYSAIEARVVAWVAKEHKVLDAFKSGKDLYKVAASNIYKKSYDEISKAERQIGKVAVLSLGYQGFTGAFLAMAKGYGIEIEEDQAKEIILAWRESHPNIVAFWRMTESAAIRAIKTKEPQAVGLIKFGMRGEFLHCRLPSGRLLSWYQPSTETITTKFGQEKEVISFWGVNSLTNKWERQLTYGGKLTENIVQAIARDILVEALLRLEKNKYDVVLHVHDEIVSEVDANFGSLKEFEQLVAENPSWALDLPLAAEGWEGIRYKK